jgi:hypothetical protein
LKILRPANCRRLPGSILGGIVCALALLPGLARGAEIHTGNPYEVIAGYLRALPAYVVWPTNTFATPAEPWQIGILGNDPFGDLLEKVLDNRQAARRGFQIIRGATVDDLRHCEIIFVAIKDESRLTDVLAQLGSRPVLTVGEQENFLALGGIIQLEVHDTIRMAINLDRARAAHLKIPTQMLELASEVIENGARKKLK